MSTLRFMWVLAFAVLGALAGARPAESRNKNAEELANAVLAHVRECLPPAASRSVDDQRRRVRVFAEIVTIAPIHPVDPAEARAAAIAAIDAANSPTANANSLVHAAIVGVSTLLRTGKLPPSTCNECQEAPHKASLPSGRQAGTIWVISLPGLHFPEKQDDPCSVLGHYFEFPTDGISALALDLRGNQGGYVPTAACVASQFLKPKTPLVRLRESSRRIEILESSATGHSPITLPLAVFVDKDTESGALAIAAALQDAKRAKLVGESKEQANGNVLAIFTTPGGQDSFALPIGEIERLNGARLAAGIQVDVAVSPKDDDALIAAACAQFAGCGEH